MQRKALWHTFAVLALAAAAAISNPGTASAKSLTTALAVQPADTTLLSLNFDNNPVLQDHPLFVRVLDKASGMEVARATTDSVVTATPNVQMKVLGLGKSYWVEFFSDLNNNRQYDGLPTDASWRMSVDNVQGPTTLTVPADLTVTPLNWNYAVILNLTGMADQVGKRMEFRLVEQSTGKEVSRVAVDSVRTADFTVTLPGMSAGNSYAVEFWADMNGNGFYEGLPIDQSWRVNVDNVLGDVTVPFQFNTMFTPLAWPYLLTLRLEGMTPNIGQPMQFRLVRSDSTAGKEIARAAIDSVTADTLAVELPGLVIGQDYHVDFFADTNRNGRYDAPPADEAWRINFTDDRGDTTIVFTRSTTFTDIQWPYVVTLNLQNMAPEQGNHMAFRMVRADTDSEVYRTAIDSVRTDTFNVLLPAALPGQSYRIDFFSDANRNGAYDTVPTDHAWRVLLDSTATDTTLVFLYNNDYIDIAWPGPVGVEERNALPKAFALYQNAPNPFNPSTVITFELSLNSSAKLDIFNIAGQKVRTLVNGKLAPGKYSYTWDGRDSNGKALSSGVYFYRLRTETMNKAMRMLLLK